MKITTILIALVLSVSLNLMAQRTLPPAVLNAIPSKYTVASQLFVKQGFMARAQITLTVPNKNACNDGLKGDCQIDIIITSYDESQKEYTDMMEKRLPFNSRLPNGSNFKASADPYNQLISCSATKEAELAAGSAAWYIQTNSCIMDQHSEYESVALKSLQGSTIKAIEININGGISAEEALAIVKELYQALSAINYFTV